MAIAAELERKVAAALQRAGYSNSGVTLVVGVSGGPDSSALLYVLHRLKDAHGLSLHVAHLNHNFRGQEAEDDAVFAADVAIELGLPYTVVKEDPHEYQRVRGISSFEQGAREMRYAFMARVAKATRAKAASVGHTSDDLAETVMLHVLRGSGLYGLRGMGEVSYWPWPADAGELKLFRPLLDVTKAQTAEYCREIGRTYRIDSGNYMWRFTRNKVRQDLMPRLAEDYNPQVRDALVRLARTAAEELDFVEQELDKIWSDVAVETGADEIRFSRSAMRKLHPLLQRLALRRGYVLVAGDSTKLRETHLVAMERMSSSGRGGRFLELPGRVLLREEYRHLVLTLSPGQESPYPEINGTHEIIFPSECGVQTSTIAGSWIVTMYAGTADQKPDWESIQSGDNWTQCFNLKSIGDVVSMRGWQSGDRIQPLGMEGHKKLQDLFTDLRVPRPWRDRVPLLETEKGIAWVVGHRMSDWAKISSNPNDPVLWVRFSQNQGESSVGFLDGLD